jgi:hypothetical protein
MAKKYTIISQIITLLHVSTLSCHPQTACNQYLAKLSLCSVCCMFSSGNSPASEFYMPTFRNTLRVCSETSAYKIQTPGNYPEENIQQIPCQVTQVFEMQLLVIQFTIKTFHTSHNSTHTKTHTLSTYRASTTVAPTYRLYI